MSNEKNKIEALLFSSGARMTAQEIAEITGINEVDTVKNFLGELKLDLEERGGSLALFDDGKYYKMTVKDHYMPIIQKVVSKTDLDKPLMETLAVIAWKYPVLQADVIKIRHNKAYEHLKLLEEMGFITRGMFGRTKKITLTDKFFQYFDLPSKEQVKNVFGDVMSEEVKQKLDSIEDDIEEGEKLREEAINKRKELEKKKKELEDKKKKTQENKEDVKEEIEDMIEKEEKELKEMEKELEGIEEEEKKDVYSQEETANSDTIVSEVQEQNEVSEQGPQPDSQE